MKNIKLLTISFFLLVISFFPFMTYISEKRAFSESEGRNLSELPKFSVEGYLNKTFSENLEVYFQDHFYKRLGLSRVYFGIEKFIGRVQINNTIVGKNDELFYTPVRSKISSEEFSEKFSYQLDGLIEKVKLNQIPIYLYLLPSKPYTMKEMYPSTSLDRFYVEKLNTMENWINPYVTYHDIGEEWKSKFDSVTISDFFYKTDHHWNGLGAYEGYKDIIAGLRKSGIDIKEPINTKKLKNVCAKGNSYFEGSHNRVILYNADQSNEYKCNWEINDFALYEKIIYQTQEGEYKEGEGIFSSDINSGKINYSRLTTGDYPYIYFKNMNSKNKINALIIKDSYTNAITSVLPYHFDETYFLDMRHYGGDISKLIEEKDINLILLLHNSVSINSNVSKYLK